MAATIEDIARALGRGHEKPNGRGGWQTFCPVHEATGEHSTPSLDLDYKDGKILLYCRSAHCSNTDIIKALCDCGLWGNPGGYVNGHDTRLNAPTLQPVKGAKGSKKKLGKVVKVYDYRDEKGVIVHQTVRFDPKDFRQRRPDGKGVYVGNLKGVRCVLYNLPQMTARPTEQVLLCEGEKDADNGAAIGFLTTTNAQGAKAWNASYNQHFANRHVVIMVDKDPDGETRVVILSRHLREVAASIKILRLPGGPKSDLSDWIDAGRTAGKTNEQLKAELGALIEQAPVFGDEKSEKIQNDRRGIPNIRSTDFMGMANLWIKMHGRLDKEQQVYLWNDWIWWYNGSRYVRQSTKKTRSLLWSFLTEDVQLEGEKGVINPNSNHVNNMRDALESRIILPDDFRPPTWFGESLYPGENLVAARNGIVDLDTGKLYPSSPRFFSMHAIEADYNPDAQCPEWFNFLETLWPDSIENINLLQQIFGYFLSTDMSQQKIFMLLGPKRSGKGTIGRILEVLLGRRSVARMGLSNFDDLFGMEKIIDKSLAIISDARLEGGERHAMLMERMLNISGEDSISIDQKYRQAWSGPLNVRFLLLTNEMPIVSDPSGAFASRFTILETIRSFYDHEDRKLDIKLAAERSGIFTWAVHGWQDLQTHGSFIEPNDSRERREQMEMATGPVRFFVEEQCQLAPDYSVKVSDLYDRYRNWAKERGIYASGPIQFSNQLHSAFPNVKTSRTPHTSGHDPDKRFRIFRGIH